jgi:hypothetical protein
LDDISIWEEFFEDEEAVEFLSLHLLGLKSNLEISTHMIESSLRVTLKIVLDCKL